MLRSRNFWKVGVGNYGTVGVGVGYFTSDEATLVTTDVFESARIVCIIRLCTEPSKVTFK